MSTKSPQGHIQQCFLNVNMGNRHDGLTKLAASAGIDVLKLSPQSYLIFVNRAHDKIAMLVGAQGPRDMRTMAYVKLSPGRKLDMRVIRELPRAFDGKSLNYDKALEAALDKALAKVKGKRVVEALL